MPKTIDHRPPVANSLPLPPLFVQRRAVLGTFAVVFCAAFLFFAGDAWAIALHPFVMDGAIASLWLLAAAGIGSLLPLPTADTAPTPRADRGDAPDQPGVKGAVTPDPPLGISSLRRVTAVGLGLGIISLVTLGLGLAGLLNRASAWSIVVLGIATLAFRSLRNFDRSAAEELLNASLREDARHSWLWLPAVVTLALACAAAMALPGLLWNAFGDPHGYDVVEYHLQIPREWFEAGRIVPLHHNAFSFFPFNVEMHYLLAMHLKGGPWAGMYLAQLMHVGFVALTVVAVASTAKALGARPAFAAIAGLTAASTPWLLLLAPIAYNEGGLLLFGTLALGWALVALRKSAGVGRGALRSFALAGAFAGFACGAKLTGVPIVLIAIACVSFVALLMQRAPLPRAIAAPAVFGVAGLLTFSPWLIRNVVWTANPVFPEAASILGKGHFTDVQVERWSQAHAARPDQRPVVERIKAAKLEIGYDWRFGAVILPSCLVIGAVFGRGRWHGRAFIVALVGFQLIFWVFFTHLQSRFFVLAVPTLALLAAAPGWRWWPAVAFAVLGGVSALTWVRAGVAMHGKIFVVEKPADLAVLASAGDEALAKRIESARRITLVGDAKAFWYPTPPDGLRYRTVFDVAGGAEVNVVDAWIGDASKGAADGELTIIDAGELGRFAKTYAKIPTLRPGDEAGHGDVVVRP